MNPILNHFDKTKKCEIIYNDYNVFKYEYKTIEEAKTIYDQLKANNFNDFYFRVFSKDFDYIHNYGEEIYELERIEPNEVLYLNETIEGLPNNKAKGKKKDDYPAYFRMGFIKGDDK
ncbi:MAG: hypothetical protein ACOX1K_05245 [Defluviitoga tunisiensis]|jgi:hypothetical protein